MVIDFFKRRWIMKKILTYTLVIMILVAGIFVLTGCSRMRKRTVENKSVNGSRKL